MSQDQEANTTTANETLRAIQGDMYDAASPTTRKGKRHKSASSTSSVCKQAGGKFSYIPQPSYVYFI